MAVNNAPTLQFRKINAKQLERMMNRRLNPDYKIYAPLMLHGSPGIGKSSIVAKIAKDHRLKLIDFRLSQADPTDLKGIPAVGEGGKAVWLSPVDFPLDSDPLPKDENGKKMNGWLLFLDEINSAPKSIQAAAYKLVLERKVNNYKLNDRVFVMAAGNLQTDNAIVEPMSSALINRLGHVVLNVTPQEWLDYATLSGYDEDILAYLNYKTDDLNPGTSEITNRRNENQITTPRSWEMLSKEFKAFKDSGDCMIKNSKGISYIDVTDEEVIATIYEYLSPSVAAKFIPFLKLKDELPTIYDIIGFDKNDKKITPITPEEFNKKDAGVRYMLVYHIASNVDKLKKEGRRNDFRTVFNFMLTYREVATILSKLLSGNEKITGLQEYMDFIDDLAKPAEKQ